MRTKVGEPVPEPSIAWEFRTGEDARPPQNHLLSGRGRPPSLYQLCLPWISTVLILGRLDTAAGPEALGPAAWDSPGLLS